MKISGIRFPAPLLSALRDGSLVVFAGAGVSAGTPASLPTFSDLSKLIAQGTNKTRHENESEDVFLGRLQHQGVHVHEIAERILRKNRCGDIPEPTNLHRDLLRLYPKSRAVRIVTTNFDRLFTEAARNVFSDLPELFKAPALPLGRTFHGIVHVHGCLNPLDDMVLTDADFGRAYLTEGWARRFLVDLFQSSTVMFIGYSHEDTVMKYLACALPTHESGKRFALTDKPDGDHWPVLGIEPISYSQKSEDDHSGLSEGIHGLANYARRGLLDWRHQIAEIVQSPPSLDEREADIINEALADVVKTEFFAEAATDPEWLDWLDQRGHLTPLFGSAHPPAPHMWLIDWICERFVFDHPGALFRLIGRHGMSLNPCLWDRLAQAVVLRTDHPLSEKTLSRWVSCLLATAPPLQNIHQLQSLAQCCIQADLINPLVEIFDAMARHSLSLRPPFPEFDDEFASHSGLPEEDIDVELISEENDGIFRELWQTDLSPRLNIVATPVLSIAITYLAARHRTFLAWGKADPDWDPESLARHAIEPHKQDQGSNHVDVLIDAARDCLKWLADNRPDAVAGWCDQFAGSQIPLLRRLCVHTLSVRNDLSVCQKLDWLFVNADLHDDATHHELFQIMRQLYPQADPERREQTISTILAFSCPNDEEEQKTDVAARHRFDWIHWLHDADPDCIYAKSALDDIRSQHPEFTPQNDPDLAHSSHPLFGPKHPWSVEELLSQPTDKWLDDLLSFCSASPFGPDRQDVVSAVSAAVKADFRWGADLAAALSDRSHWDSDLWIALFRVWREARLDGTQLNEALGYLRKPELLDAYPRRIADLILTWLKKLGTSITGDLLAQTNQIATKVWELTDHEAAPEPCDSWLALATGCPVGILAQYWLQQRSLLREFPDSLPDTLLADVTASLSIIVQDPSVSGLMGRAVLAGEVAFLLDTEEEWTRKYLIPRFTQQFGAENYQEDYQAVWDGFLTRSRFTPLVSECLKDAFLKAAPLIPVHFQSGWRLDHFVDIWTVMLSYVADDPVGTWLPEFFEHANDTARHRFASEIGRHLRQMDDAWQCEWWGRWLESYWSHRLNGVPRPLDDAEIRLMIGWLPAFGSLFSTAVELALGMPSVPIFTNQTIDDLYRGNHAHDFPNDVAKLLIHLGKHASRDYAWNRGRELTETLLSSGNLSDDLREPLRELAAKLGPA